MQAMSLELMLAHTNDDRHSGVLPNCSLAALHPVVHTPTHMGFTQERCYFSGWDAGGRAVVPISSLHKLTISD